MNGNEFRFENLLLDKLDQITNLLSLILQENKNMSAELDTLTAQVAETLGVEQSAVVLLQGIVAKLNALAEQLAQAGLDNAAVLALSDELHTQTDALAAAVAAVPPTP